MSPHPEWSVVQWGHMLSDLRERFRDFRATPWDPLTTPQFAVGLAILVIGLGIYLASADGWIPILDSLNLVFHEAGHPLFSPFGETLHILGGTLMQLIVPAVVVGTCWTKRQPLGAALASMWFFQNGFNIGRYMADARAQILPLAGGGEHDWGTLFADWGVLQQDLAYGATARGLAWIGLTATLLWMAWRWRLGRISSGS